MPVKGGSDEDSKKDVRSQRFSDEWRRVAAVERPPPVRESLGSRGGVQLWSVREQLKENWDGTLHQLAAIGYREVELFETPKSPGEFRRGVENAGLKCVSGHFELKDLKDPATIAAAQQLGLTYMILVFPALPSLEGQSVLATTSSKVCPA